MLNNESWVQKHTSLEYCNKYYCALLEKCCKGIKVKIISELEDLERQRADKKEPDKNIESRIEDLQNQLLDMLK